MVHEEQGHQAGVEDAYTLKKALHEASTLLQEEFGQADQDAAVALATFLYHAHERDEFLKRADDDALGSGYTPPQIF